MQKTFKAENAPAVKAAKADTDLKYSKYQKSGKKMADGGDATVSFDESFESPREQLSRMKLRKDIERGIGATSDIERKANERMVDYLTSIPSKFKEMLKGQGSVSDRERQMAKNALRGQGAVTDKETTISRTVTPPLQRKSGGKAKK